MINFIIKKKGKSIKCTAYFELLLNHIIKLVFNRDENFVIIYESQNYCKFKFVEDLDKKEEELVEKFKSGEMVFSSL